MMQVTHAPIPSHLAILDHWVCWRKETRKGNPTKVPYNPLTLLHAKVNDASTWCDLHTVETSRNQYDGIGVALTKDLRIVGWDLDDCINPDTGVIDDWAQHIVNVMCSYTEITPSGTGLRIFAHGTLPGKIGGTRQGKMEVYAHSRYLTVTQNVLARAPACLEDRQEQIDALYAELFPAPPPPPSNGHRDARTNDLGDAAVLETMCAARNGPAIRALFNGDWSAYASQSEADLALCSHLAFFTGRDAAQIDRLVRQSGLYREKWDVRHGDMTYGDKTIAKALEGCTETYQPSRAISGTTGDTGVVECPERLIPFALATVPDSFVSEYVAYAATRTDAPPQAHEAMALGILSALVPPALSLPIATSPKGWRLLLWILYIVDSTTGRKTTTLDLARDILVGVLGEAALIQWEGSPQGLIQRLQTRDGQASVFTRDEYSSLLQQMNRGGHMAGLAQTFIRAYDGGVIENIRTRKRHKDTGVEVSDTDRVDTPYLVKLCASTRTAFLQRATIDNVLDGFLARFIFVDGTAIPREPTAFTPAMRDARDSLIAHAQRFHAHAEQVTQVAFAPTLLRDYWAIEQEFLANASNASHPEAAGPSMKRLAETTLKVAALLTLDETDTTIPLITVAHLDTAAVIVRRWMTSTLDVLDALGTTTFQRDCDAVWASIAHEPAIPMATLYRVHRRLKKRDFEDILNALIEQGRIRVEQDHASDCGRPPKQFYAIHEGGRP